MEYLHLRILRQLRLRDRRRHHSCVVQVLRHDLVPRIMGVRIHEGFLADYLRCVVVGVVDAKWSPGLHLQELLVRRLPMMLLSPADVLESAVKLVWIHFMVVGIDLIMAHLTSNILMLSI